MAKLSIIIPTYHEEQTIEAFLVNLKSCIYSIESVEVIVVDAIVDGVSSRVVKRVTELAMKYPDYNLSCFLSAKGRALQMNEGSKVAVGDCLLFLHSDTQLPSNFSQWWGCVSEGQVAWGFFRVRLEGKRWPFRMIETCMNCRSKITEVGTGDQCLFVRKDVWVKVGGFKEITLMEDVDICKRLRKYASPLVWLGPVTTSSRRWEKNGIFRTIILMWVLRLGYFLGISPKHLVSLYRTVPKP